MLVRTVEEVNLPSAPVEVGQLKGCIAADIMPRSTLFRSGVLLLATKVDSGYHGKLVFALNNLLDLPFTFELGARIAHIIFILVSGPCSPYRGQWKGGRVAVPHGEVQV